MAKREKRRSAQSRRWQLPALVAMVAAVGLWWWLRPGAAPVLPAPAEPVREALPRAAPDFPGRFIPNDHSGKPKASLPDVPVDKAEFNRRKAELTAQALKDVQTWMKYPLWSSLLTENMQYKKPEPFHTMSKGPEDDEPSVELWPEKLNYGVGEPIRIFATFRNHGVTRPDHLNAHTMGGHRPRPEIPLDFQDQGDGTLVATLNIADEMARRNRGEWGVIVESFVAGQRRGPTTQFFIMATDAKVTGPYRVALEDGSLAVYVGVTGSAPSRQHLKGELWGGKGEAISYAWVRDDHVHVGLNTMKLVFYGKVIRDSGIDGPYEIRNLLLTTFDDNNDRIENPAVDPQLRTDAYGHTAFTDKSINGDNAMLKEKQQILAEELENAKKGLYDPYDPIPARPSRVSKDSPLPQ